jgi:hypothetical protein
MRNTNPTIKIDSGELKIIDNNNNVYIGFDNNTKTINFSENIILKNTNPTIKVLSGELDFIDNSNNNYLGINTISQSINAYQLFEMQKNLSFSQSIFYIQDSDGVEYMSFNKETKKIRFIQSLDVSGGVPQPSFISNIIFNVPTDFIISDNLNRNYIECNPVTYSIKLDAPVTLPNIIFSNDELFIQDMSGNKFLGFNRLTQSINFFKPTDLPNGGGIGDASGIVFPNDTFTFSDSLNRNYLIFDKPNQKVKVTQPIDLQTILFSNDILYIKDSNGFNYMAFNKVDKTIQFIAPIDSGGVPVVSYISRINFIGPSIFSINDNSNRTYLECDPNTFSLNLFAPINCKTDNIISYTNTLSFTNNNGWNMLKLNNSSNGSFDISANIHITMDSPKIQIQSGELTFVDISNNKYIGIDISNQVVKINKTLDLSNNGNIIFNTDLNFISNKQNILSIKQKNNLPIISYSEKLIIQNTTTNEVYANPIIKYNIISENVNSFEKKYLAKTSIPNGTGVIQYYFRNVIDAKDEQITFKGKIISRDLENNSASFTFEGYTKYMSPTNTNILEFELNPLYTSDPNWKLNSFFIYSTDLVMEVQSDQPTTTNWVVAIESISV